jgi:branched-chain amino acid transport system permease protein
MTAAHRLVQSSGLLVVLAFAVLAPFILPSFELTTFAGAIPLGIVVLGVNLLTGLNGQISIGHSAFYGIGAYLTVIAVNQFHFGYLAAGVVGTLGGALAGLIVGLPALRLRGLYIAITTLGLGLAFPGVIQHFSSVTGGTEGAFFSTPLSAPSWTGLRTQVWVYFVSLVGLIVVLAAARNLKRSRTGRAIVAIRDNELVAESFGVKIAAIKVGVFSISAGLAGFGGVLYAVQQQFVSPTTFSFTLSLSFLVGMAIGGPESVLGAVVGGLFIQYAPTVVGHIGVTAELTPVLYAALLLFFVYAVRQGVAGLGASALDRTLALLKAK